MHGNEHGWFAGVGNTGLEQRCCGVAVWDPASETNRFYRSPVVLCALVRPLVPKYDPASAGRHWLRLASLTFGYRAEYGVVANEPGHPGAKSCIWQTADSKADHVIDRYVG